MPTVLTDHKYLNSTRRTISSSLNLPAETLYPSLETLYSICLNGSIRLVVFYGNNPRESGTTVAGWFADAIDEVEFTVGHSRVGSEGVVLEGGLRGWVKGGRNVLRGWRGLRGRSGGWMRMRKGSDDEHSEGWCYEKAGMGIAASKTNWRACKVAHV